jgi:hypothetical protein
MVFVTCDNPTIWIVADNLGCKIALEKGWSSDARLACMIREILELTEGWDLKLRWIPTNLNPADDPTRGSPASDCKIDQALEYVMGTSQVTV